MNDELKILVEATNKKINVTTAISRYLDDNTEHGEKVNLASILDKFPSFSYSQMMNSLVSLSKKGKVHYDGSNIFTVIKEPTIDAEDPAIDLL